MFERASIPCGHQKLRNPVITSGNLPQRRSDSRISPLRDGPLPLLRVRVIAAVGMGSDRSPAATRPMQAYDYDLVCIGSGPAGQRAAVQAAKIGKRVVVIEKQPCLGGVCLGTGTIPSKTLREAVLFFNRAANRDRRGSGPSPRPTAEQLLAKVDEVVASEQSVIEDQLRRNDVDVLLGEASFVDPHTLVVRSDAEVRQVTADRIVIAVGTYPAPPPGVAAEGEEVVLVGVVVRLEAVQRVLAVRGG